MSWKWAYGPSNERKGPFSWIKIEDLIKKGEITPETRLCNYREKTDYPAIKTEFSVYFPEKDFIDATKDAQVPDYWMWIAVFTPVVFLTIIYFYYVFMGLELVNIISLAGKFSWACFAYADCLLMARRGFKPPARIITIILYAFFDFPMPYFYSRNRQLRRRQKPTWISAACFFLIIGIVGCAI